MKTGAVELKLQGGAAIKIKGSADFAAAATASILKVRKEKASDQVDEAGPGLRSG